MSNAPQRARSRSGDRPRWPYVAANVARTVFWSLLALIVFASVASYISIEDSEAVLRVIRLTEGVADFIQIRRLPGESEWTT